MDCELQGEDGMTGAYYIGETMVGFLGAQVREVVSSKALISSKVKTMNVSLSFIIRCEVNYE